MGEGYDFSTLVSAPHYNPAVAVAKRYVSYHRRKLLYEDFFTGGVLNVGEGGGWCRTRLDFTVADGERPLLYPSLAVPLLGAGVTRHQQQVPPVHIDSVTAEEVLPRHAAHAFPL